MTRKRILQSKHDLFFSLFLSFRLLPFQEYVLHCQQISTSLLRYIVVRYIINPNQEEEKNRCSISIEEFSTTEYNDTNCKVDNGRGYE